MPNYQNSKIYKIVSDKGPLVYFGTSTLDRLCQRMAFHMDNYKRWKNGKAYKIASFILFDEYGPKNCKIVLVEAFQCNTKDELKAREKYYIENFDCVNKNITEIIRDEYNKAEMNEHVKKCQKQKNSSEKFACECGGKYIMLNKNVHFKSKKHLNYINGLNV
jgi:hypothetical protein